MIQNEGENFVPDRFINCTYRFWEAIEISIEAPKDALVCYNQNVIPLSLELQNHLLETVRQVIIGLIIVRHQCLSITIIKA